MLVLDDVGYTFSRGTALGDSLGGFDLDGLTVNGALGHSRMRMLQAI